MAEESELIEDLFPLFHQMQLLYCLWVLNCESKKCENKFMHN